MAAVKLASIEPLKAAGQRPVGLKRSEGFVARFEADQDALPQGDRIYAIHHEDYGAADIYFSPSADRLVAVFN